MPRSFGVELISGGLARVEIARHDINFRSVLHESVSYHLADATTTASYNRYFVLDVEERSQIQRVHSSILLVGGSIELCRWPTHCRLRRANLFRKVLMLCMKSNPVVHLYVYSEIMVAAIMSEKPLQHFAHS